MKRKLPKAKMKYGRAEKLFSSSRLEVGDTGPDFTGLTKDMASFELYRQGRDRLKIINSITSIDTKGGLRQIAEFNRLIPRAKDDIFTVNICSDLPFAIERFCNGESTSLGQLVSDYKNMDFGKKYGYETEDSRLLTSGVVVLDRKNKVIFHTIHEKSGYVSGF